MSRREDRSSDARRHRSRFDREPSPKRPRRDDNKPERERPSVDTKDRDSDNKHHRQFRDPLPLESASAHDSKIETRTMNKDTDNRINASPEITKKSSDPTKVPQPRSYSQHDDRAGVGQNGRTFNRGRTDKEYGSWRDSKEDRNDRIEVKEKVASDVKDDKPSQNGRTFNRGRTDKEYGSWRDSKEDRNDRTEVKEKVASDVKNEKPSQNGRAFNRGRTDKEHGSWRDSKEDRNDRTEVKEKVASDVKDEKPKDGRDENQAWRNKGNFQMETNPARKRPAFREHKLPAVDSEKTAPVQDYRHGGVESGRRSERRFNFNSERSGRHERSFTRDRDLTKGEEVWCNSRDRYGGGKSGYRGAGREGFNVGQQGYNRLSGDRVEKWKHDLYDEANKSPKAKNEEDQISKIEALLAS